MGRGLGGRVAIYRRGKEQWVWNTEVAITSCVLGTMGGLVKLEHMSVTAGNLGNDEGRKTDHRVCCRLCRGTWIWSAASGSLGRILWQMLPVHLSYSLGSHCTWQANSREFARLQGDMWKCREFTVLGAALKQWWINISASLLLGQPKLRAGSVVLEVPRRVEPHLLTAVIWSLTHQDWHRIPTILSYPQHLIPGMTCQITLGTQILSPGFTSGGTQPKVAICRGRGIVKKVCTRWFSWEWKWEGKTQERLRKYNSEKFQPRWEERNMS